jgi:hypothetical protein
MLPHTRAEATRFTETSLHADVVAFINALEKRRDSRLFVTSFGASAQNRDLPLLVLSGKGAKSPDDARALGLPVVMVMAGIHAGEVEGKEACLMLVRDLLEGVHGPLLDRLTLVVMPLFNPDGNDAIDPGNRALVLPKLTGQMGPSSVGTRTTSENINLNRDYLRCSAQEMRCWMAAWHAWRPDLTIDNHATNGSVHRFHMTYDVPHLHASAPWEPIRYMRDELTPWVAREVKTRHGYESGWYGNFVEDEATLEAGRDIDPHSVVGSGWVTYPHHPRFGANYRGLFGGLDLLLEAYSYISFKDRVGVAYAWMLESLRFVADNTKAVQVAVTAGARCPDEVAIRSKLEAYERPIEILTRVPRTLEGSETVVRARHVARFVAEKAVRRPEAYLIPAALAVHLRQRGLETGKFAQGTRTVDVPYVTGFGSTPGRGILEAGSTGDIQVRWQRESRDVQGMVSIPTEQRGGALAVYLLEPESDDHVIESGLLDAPDIGQWLPLFRTT